MKVDGITLRNTKRAKDQQTHYAADSRVYVSLHDMLRLQHKARGFSFLPRQPLTSLLAGRHASKIRGRGLNFEEIRNYHQGDDIRSIDWKVTARTQKPHVRVFTEERERRAILLVDQMINMFYGSQVNMKSVTAAHTAALGAWRILAMGDSVGAIVFNDSEIVEIRPQRTKRNVMRIIRAIVEMNHKLDVGKELKSNPTMLNKVLETAQRTAGHDYLIAVISDFEGADDMTRRHLLRLAQHNDVICALIHDPSATKLPSSGDYVISDGELQIEVDFGKRTIRKKVLNIAKGRIARILAWQQEIRVPILPINTVEDVAEQIRHLIGEAITLGRR